MNIRKFSIALAADFVLSGAGRAPIPALRNSCA